MNSKRSKLMTALVVVGTLFGVAAATGSGCGAKTAFDCHAICQKYHDCYDNDYDVGKCSDSCRDKAFSDDKYEDKANACASCIGDKSCVGSTFSCPTECAGVVGP